MSEQTPEPATAANIRELYASGRRDFQRADLRGADLSESNLRGANLRESNLRRADLSESNLSRADLSGADLSRADLRGADLSESNLRGADLSRADLSRADLSRADLRGADLSRADLSGADLSRADLSGADLRGAKNIDVATAARLMRCPAEGAFVAYKQCRGGAIVKLMIPAEAARSSATGYKCRAEFADVLEGKGISIHDGKTIYTPGQRVTCHEWDADRWNECGGGIHFYMSREEAEANS